MREEGGIYLRGTTWWIDVNRNGERIRRSARTRDKKKAQQLYDKLASEIWKEEALGEQPNVTLAQVMLEYFKVNKKNKAIDYDSHRMVWLRDQFGDATPLVEITPDEVVKRKSAELWHGKQVSDSTVNRQLSALSSLYTLAVKKKWIATRPHFPFFSEVGNQRTQRMSRLDMVKLIAELPWHLALIYSFGSMTGLRENNVIGLRWRQVDFDNKVVRYEVTDMKGKRLHLVPLADDAVALLRLAEGGSEEYVFTWRGKPTHKVSNHAWYKALRRAGLVGMTFHEATRHTWASWHAMNGTPLQVLKELGGWSDMRMVERYTHLAPEHVAKYAGNAKVK